VENELNTPRFTRFTYFLHQLFAPNSDDIDLYHGKSIRKFGINDTKLKYEDFVCLIITKLNIILKNIKLNFEP